MLLLFSSPLPSPLEKTPFNTGSLVWEKLECRITQKHELANNCSNQVILKSQKQKKNLAR